LPDIIKEITNKAKKRINPDNLDDELQLEALVGQIKRIEVGEGVTEATPASKEKLSRDHGERLS
jgi:hypothetical protein